ncbi:DEAD/DEAH box helicase [Orrella sp. NBD-18]|uniref:DEAD/DEAH box helicase n=1 Tax=Sheuella amnicola TaxID=2707330 RepID=A0A6B2QUS1_9BURK|nr:DEAD/DEAH box helicase [Sheuella amnicola]NDY82396.1 DEAD/DEAH box helicase [Sheuella amnicola]
MRAIADSGYTAPTPIQAQAIPRVLTGGDLLAAAQTGTGKTAGFTLPILHILLNKPAELRQPGRPRVLILSPTRELSAQIQESVKTYGQYTKISSMVMFGGVNINPQINALRKPLDILVATPGRLLDHCQQKTVNLSGVEILVLDEADRMLDMGFIRDIRKILALLPRQRQNLLFSATFSDEIRELSKGVLHNASEVSVAARNTTAERVDQTVHIVDQAHKRDILSHIIRESGWHQVLVFTRTKHGANRLAEKLVKDGLSAAAIHGNKSQAARTRALEEFKNGKVAVLVATDIAARGLDIDQLPQVVNFELPNVPEDYVHRIGRTGRAGAAGSAVSLVDSSEIKYLKAIERLIKKQIPQLPAPTGWTPSPNSSHGAADDARAAGQRNGQRRHGASRSSSGRTPGSASPGSSQARSPRSGHQHSAGRPSQGSASQNQEKRAHPQRQGVRSADNTGNASRNRRPALLSR